MIRSADKIEKRLGTNAGLDSSARAYADKIKRCVSFIELCFDCESHFRKLCQAVQKVPKGTTNNINSFLNGH